jgi:hypothetical protein
VAARPRGQHRASAGTMVEYSIHANDRIYENHAILRVDVDG